MALVRALGGMNGQGGGLTGLAKVVPRGRRRLRNVRNHSTGFLRIARLQYGLRHASWTIAMPLPSDTRCKSGCAVRQRLALPRANCFPPARRHVPIYLVEVAVRHGPRADRQRPAAPLEKPARYTQWNAGSRQYRPRQASIIT